MAILWISYAALWVIVAIQGFAFLELLRQIGVIRKELGPKQGALIVPGAINSGEKLPELSGRAATTLRTVTNWDDYLGVGLSLIVCFKVSCDSCREIAADLAGFAADVRDDSTVVALVEGSVDDAQAFVRETHLAPHMVIIDEGGAMTRQLGVSWNPGAVTVRGRKLGEAAIVNSVSQLSALIYDKTLVQDERRIRDGIPA